ncbi:MAG: TRAP transporter substrate-binding protein [Desulfobacterales bacterium]|nr:TRAP transporter substrate-binding protein [Desulfobacterales bacterium]
MKSKRILWLAILCFAAATLFPTFAAASAPIELSLSLMIPSRHTRYLHVLDPWIKMLEEKTKGQVKVTVYFANALASSPEMFDSTVNGMADITENATFVNPGRFPATEIVQLPELGFKTSLDVGKAMWHLYKTFPEFKNEYKGVKLLWFTSSPPMRIATTKKPIRTVEDFKNMKIWYTGSAPVKTGKALGSSPVSMAPGDVYLSLEKGVIDGAIADNEIFVSRRFVDVCKYYTEVDICSVPFYMIMNQQKYDSLPADVKKVLDDLTGDWAVEFAGKIRDKEEKEAEVVARGKGIEYITFSPEERAKMRKMVEPVKEEYITMLESKKLPGKKMMEEINKLVNK